MPAVLNNNFLSLPAFSVCEKAGGIFLFWRKISGPALLIFLLVVMLSLPMAAAGRLPLTVYSSADGLVSSVIHHITRDSQGFLWFCARGGLSRFDGYEFTTYRFGDEQTSFLVHYFLESRDGTFWIATDSGLYRVKPQEKTEFLPAADVLHKGERRLNAVKVSARSFFTLFEDTRGRLWGGATEIDLIENKDAENVTLQKIDFNPDGQNRPSAVNDFTETADGSVWAADSYAMVRILPDGRSISYEVPHLTTKDESYAIKKDIRGRIWFSHITGVFIFQPEPLEVLANLPNRAVLNLPVEEKDLDASGTIDFPADSKKMIKLLFRDKKEKPKNKEQHATAVVEDLYPAIDGKVWVPTRKSLYIFEGEKYQSYSDSTSLPGTTKQITEDLQGNIWFGTFSGAVKYKRNGLITYNETSNFPDPVIHLIEETPGGELLVFHGNWYVSRRINNDFESTQLNLPESSRFSWTAFPIFQDSAGSLWALTFKGLYHYPPPLDFTSLGRQIPQNISVPNILPKDAPLYRAFSDSHQNIWFSVRGATAEESGLYKYNIRSNEWQDYSNIDGYPKGNSIVSFAEDKAGNLWFGFYSRRGLFKYDGKRFIEITAADGLPGGAIFALHTDKQGRLWIGSTESGLTRLDDPAAEKPVFIRYTENEGLAANNVRCLAEDRQGNIYAGTVRGVSLINPETGQIRQLTTDDGLAADFVHTAFRDHYGTMWFGTSNGLSKFEPVTEKPSGLPQIFLSDLEIAGVNYALSEFGQHRAEGFDLSAAQNNLQIGFFGIGEGKALRYQYKLEGTRGDWSKPTEQRSVNFANLSSGDYRFLVRAINEAGEVSENPAVVSFTIRPPFWRSWWFLTLVILLTAGAVFALDRYRVAKTKQVENALDDTKRANVMIQESETRFRTLADTASDAILTIDEETRIIFVNQAIEMVFGYSAAELIGQKLSLLIPETGTDNTAWEGMELAGLHKSGHEIPLEVSFGEFEREGKRYFTGIARDISERIRAEAELRKAREEKFRELEKVRTRIATDLHDDIGSSLTQIAVLSEVARGQANHLQSETLTPPLERIKNVSKELVAVMSDIVWAINPNKDNLPDLVQRMRRFASDIFSGKGIRFEFHTPEIDERVQLGANIRREVFAIFKESVNNTVKYADCNHVIADFKIENEWLTLKITDNGRGFDTSKILSEDFKPEMGGNGLVNIRRRAGDLGGRCEILSEPDKGTSIILHVPLHPY